MKFTTLLICLAALLATLVVAKQSDGLPEIPENLSCVAKQCAFPLARRKCAMDENFVKCSCAIRDPISRLEILTCARTQCTANLSDLLELYRTMCRRK